VKLLLASKSDTGRSKSVSGQRLVNMYAEDNPEGAKYPFTLYGTPGSKIWEDASFTGAFQGGQVMAGSLYVFNENYVTRYDTSATPTDVGNLTGSAVMLDLANNGTQMVAVNPTDGTAFVITSTTVTQITDVDFPLVDSVCFLDGYFIFSRKDTGKFIISSLYDGTTYDALDFATAEESPDNLVRVTAFNGALWLPGTDSYEFYSNTGNADFPFEQIGGAVNTSRGIAARFAVAQEDNTMFFLGNDRVVYRMQGYSPVRVSTYAVEEDIESYDTIDDAFMFIYTQGGHKFVVLTFPTANATHVYDISTGIWHERSSASPSPRFPSSGGGGGIARWRANFHAYFAGKNLIGDFGNGKIYELDLDRYDDDGIAITRLIEGSVQWADGDRVIHDRVRLDFEAGSGMDFTPIATHFIYENEPIGENSISIANLTSAEASTLLGYGAVWVEVEQNDGTYLRTGLGGFITIGTTYASLDSGLLVAADAGNVINFFPENTPQPPGLHRSPQVMMRYSDDGKRTWSNERWTSMGDVGEYKQQAIWRRNGAARERIYQFKITDPVKVVITGAYIDARKGVS
jgi:hypothetical protein